jgi:subtilisin family serine protease/chitodextrinase
MKRIMKRNSLKASLFLLAWLLFPAGSVIAKDQEERVRVWIGFERHTPEAVAEVRAAGGAIHHEFSRLKAVAATLPKSRLDALKRKPNIIAIEEDPIRMPYAQATPYGISMVQADLVSDASAHARKICVIDSGYAINHADLQNSFVTFSADSGSGDPMTDKCGHGTHVAGTIAALDNAEGVVGVLPSGQINLHIVKVFGDSCNWTYSSSLVAAADKCVASGANVISMSLGGTYRSFYENTAFKNYYSQGVLSVAAAGNNGTTQMSYPASYDSVISVAAVDSNKTVASFSQKNTQVELSAPGVGVLSTVPWLSQNSLAVSGVTYNGGRLEGAAQTTASGVTGNLVDGGQCTAPGSWGGMVVLCERGTNTFCEKTTHVMNGGGVAAVVYNNVSGGFSGTLGAACAGAVLPGIGISQEEGQAARVHVNQPGTVTSLFVDDASGYETMDGTSMATPHVAGVAALVWSHGSSCSNAQVRQALSSSAEDLGPAGRDNAYGYGLVRAANALAALQATGCAGGGNPNVPPTASFTSSCTGLNCSFNGAGSSDTDGAVASHAWDFGDGSGGSGMNASHTYAAAGSYSVKLTVTDDDGATGETTRSVVVTSPAANTPPSASFTFSCSGLNCSFNGSGSSDGDGSIVNYAWNFGDGGSAAGSTASHTYAAAGTYTVGLTVTDDDAATGTTSQAVTVTAPPSSAITLSAAGTQLRGWKYIRLAWSGAGTSTVDIFRNGSKIVSATSNDGLHTDSIYSTGSATYSYKVCEAGSASKCSNEAMVSF